MTQPLTFIEIETAVQPEFSVIWLHGLGATANDFVPIVPELKLSPEMAVRFIFPQALSIPVTVNGGYVMPAWYDILEMAALSRKVDQAGITHSVANIRQLIQCENARGIATSHIFLAGFSQGGAIAYQTALTHPERLAGMIALSTYLPDAALLQREFNPIQKQLPIFAGHGVQDSMVPLLMGKNAATVVTHLGCQVAWHEYAMEHQVCLQEINELAHWLTGRIETLNSAEA